MLFTIIILIVINTIIISIIIINTISIIVIVIFTVTTNVFTTNRLKWNAAKSTRESLRSKLASINSAAEEEAVTALRTPNGWMWIIVYRHPNIKRPWLWVDGSRVSYALWNDKDINNSGEKTDCAHVMSTERRRNKKNTIGEILAQRIMGYLGQVTEAFGHFLYMLTSRYLDQQTLSFKMMPRTACHPLRAANLKN